MDPLHQKLESEGLKGVVYMVVNHQGAQAQRLHPMLAQRLSENITLYKQDEVEPDVWKVLGGQKDDFLIYDRFVTFSGCFTCPVFFNHHYYCCCFHLCLTSVCFFITLPSDAAVSPTTFHFHTPSLGMATLRMQSERPTVSVRVGTAHMR